MSHFVVRTYGGENPLAVTIGYIYKFNYGLYTSSSTSVATLDAATLPTLTPLTVRATSSVTALIITSSMALNILD